VEREGERTVENVGKGLEGCRCGRKIEKQDSSDCLLVLVYWVIFGDD
jgi:hypothetical protein